ncbi:hypothetical protein [Arthrobacter bambusae]|uniref:Uncharacterized protein n=1 Tax=Arthrobacter bambusae TaxID=1338426 RepID=A0AAW8DG80_9MICC|nr:hypothetical protein [Arthrobacter bambusae]MDP9905578.1 hypothetical protein [Arthrobacter bambusae]MDQ0127340.1 hypothetical protein [Arthrobacter bambusae]MDQ0178682.1 hypothetical protein [Arthrobacter bambusae]
MRVFPPVRGAVAVMLTEIEVTASEHVGEDVAEVGAAAVHAATGHF